jgi:hypothetical protein
MPLPKITDQLIASTRTVDPGWSLLVLTEPPTTKQAASGNSDNHFFKFQAEVGPNNSEENKGRLVTYMVSESALEFGIADVSGPYLQMMCALSGLTATELNGQEVDEKALVGRKVWALIGDKEREGKIQKEFHAFAPATEVPF